MIKIKKIITALLNKTVNDKLREYEEIQVVMNDIQYQEGIIEALEISSEIEFIILSELLPGEYTIKELIEKIKNIKKEIKIIIILEKENKELENYLFAKGNINIFYNNEIKVKEIAELIINKKENLEFEIEKLKEIIMTQKENKEVQNYKNNLNNNNENKKEIILTENEKREIEQEIEKEYTSNFFINKLLENRIIKKIINTIKKEKIENKSKIIIISGISGVGKSVFTVNLAKTFEKQKKNVLIIDFDFVNNCIQTLFGIKMKKDRNKIENKMENEINNKINYDNKLNKINDIQNINDTESSYFNIQRKTTLNDITIKINSKINLISNVNVLFSENKIDDLQLLKKIKEMEKEYDFILLDTEINNDYIKAITEESEKIIFITEPNIIQIKKSKQLLNNYIDDYSIEKEKIYILFNKVKNDSISFNILKEVFKNYNIIGKINFIENCNTLINQNMKSIFLEDKIKQQYKNIAKKISQNNKIKNYYLNKIE